MDGGSTVGVASRDRIVRRTTILLAIAQGLLYATLPILLSVGTVAAESLTGGATAVGVLTAVYFLAAAAGALVTGRWMDRVGRRPGLLVGYVLVAIGGVGSAGAIAVESFPALVLATVPFGAGAGGALLGRLAVADLYPPERRGRAVGLMLTAGTVGAVGSPPLVALIQRVAEGHDLDPLVVPWFAVPVFAGAAIACVRAVRPDPRELAVGTGTAEGGRTGNRVGFHRRGPRELMRVPAFRAAIVAGGIGQAAMIAVMSVAALVVHDHGGGEVAVSGTLSVHFVGMFALMPLVGVVLDRWGRRRGLIAGAILSLVGAPVASIAPAPGWVAAGLFLVGLGWSFAYLGSTTVVSDVTDPSERGGALGFTDLVVSISSGVGGLGGGILLDLGGFRTLTLAVAALLVPVLVFVFPVRERSPGAFVPSEAT